MSSPSPDSGKRSLVTGATVRMEPVPPEERARRARAQLRQAIWDASQFMSLADIGRLTDDVCSEIRSDEP